jgi:hypothetical protein
MRDKCMSRKDDSLFIAALTKLLIQSNSSVSDHFGPQQLAPLEHISAPNVITTTQEFSIIHMISISLQEL